MGDRWPLGFVADTVALSGLLHSDFTAPTIANGKLYVPAVGQIMR